MAVAPGVAAGQFVVISRGGEWDELLLVSPLAPEVTPNGWVARTTDATGGSFIWVLVSLVPG
eukprot:3130910-Karenia_brevis.AAC.1